MHLLPVRRNRSLNTPRARAAVFCRVFGVNRVGLVSVTAVRAHLSQCNLGRSLRISQAVAPSFLESVTGTCVAQGAVDLTPFGKMTGLSGTLLHSAQHLFGVLHFLRR